MRDVPAVQRVISRRGDSAARGRFAVAIAVAAATYNFIAPATAQPAPGQPAARARQPRQVAPPPKPQFVPSRDRDAEAWLRKARQARDEGDWKLFADTLHRVVGEHASAPVSADLNESARAARLSPAHQVAWLLMADAPPEAREAFRTIYEPQARQLADEPRSADGDSVDDRLERVVARYFPTDAGAAALQTLIARCVDQRRWFEALRLIEQAEAFHAPLPRWPLLLRKALACAALRQSERAEASLDEADRLPAGDGPADAAERTAQVRGLIRDQSALAAIAGASDEIRPGSATYERYDMGGLDPAALAVEPQSVPLARGAEIDGRAALDEARKTFRAPVWQAVVRGPSLFVTTLSGFVALDPVSLERQWQPFTSALKASRERPPPSNPFGSPVRSNRPPDGLNMATRRAVYDSAAGAIAAMDDQVVLLEQPAPPEDDSGGAVDFDLLLENSLAAYDARTGKLLWTKGRTGPIEDRLMGAHFFSAPVRVGAHFVAPMQVNAEWSLLVMDHAGRTVRNVILGSAPEDVWPAGRLLPPAVADGEIYLCTGMGAVFALSASDYSVLWCTSYDRTASTYVDARGFVNQVDQAADDWLENPPLVCGDLLLVAACDCRELLALNRWDGSVRWRAPRGSLRHLIAADDRHVYASGGIVQAFALRPDGSTAKSAWSVGGLELTGRPILSGDRVLAPTRTGLVALSAADGAVLESRDAPALAGLGNLMISDGALFSVEFDRVRRFSDPRSELERVAERLSNEVRGDMERRRDRLRMATLLIRLQRWDEALAALDGGAPQPEGAPADRLSGPEPDHLRVAALLGAAASATERAAGEPDLDAAAELLQRAAALAARADDRFAVATRLAHLERDRGRPSDAFNQLAGLLDPSADVPMTADSRRRVRAALVVAEELQSTWAELSAGQRDAAAKRLDDDLRRCVDSRDWAGVLRLADATGFCDVGARADLLLARRSLDERLPETAEYHLRRAVDRASDETLAADACARMVYLLDAGGPSPLARPTAAAPFLERLRGMAPSTPLPADIAMGGQSHSPAGSTATIGEFLAARAVPPPAAAPAPDWQAAAGPLEVTSHGAHLGVALRVETWPAESNEQFDDELLRRTRLIVTTEGVVGFDPARDEGQPNWRVDLEIPFADLGIELRSAAGDAPGPAAVSGSIAAVPTARGMAFIGLTTGQVVAAPCVTAEGARQSGRPAAAAAGMFVVRVDDNTLVGLPARQDARPQWRLTLNTPRIESVSSADGCAIAATRGCTRLWVIDPTNGRVRGEYDSGEPPRGTKQAARHDMACLAGPYWITARGRRLTALHVTAGQTVWQTELDAGVREVRVVDRQYLGVSHANRFRLVNIRNGNALPSVKVTDAVLPPVDAAVAEGGRLLLLLRTQSDPLIRDQRLDWCSLSSGDVLRSEGPWADAVLTPNMLRCSPYVVPVVRCHEPGPVTAGADEPRRPTVSLAMYDKVGGTLLGPALQLTSSGVEGEQSVVRVVDVLLEPDRAILVNELQRWICRFGEPLR